MERENELIFSRTRLSHYGTRESEDVLIDPQTLEVRRRLAVARIEDATHRLAALAQRTYSAREIVDETDTRQAMVRETERTADALDLIVALLTRPKVEF